MMTDDQILEVVQAHKEGKKIQYYIDEQDATWEYTDNPKWNFEGIKYRVAPEPPKPREWIIRLDPYQSHAGYILPTAPHFTQDKNEEVRVREVIE